jgi:hypothetical protein
MNSRNPLAIRRNFAQPDVVGQISFAKPAWRAPNDPVAADGDKGHDNEILRFSSDCSACSPGGLIFPTANRPARDAKTCTARQGWRFCFVLRRNAIESWVISTKLRGLAACVSPLSFWQFLPLWPLRAALKTPIRPQTVPLFAPSAVRPRGLSSLMRLVAARPRARLSAHWLAAFHAACRGFLPATEQGQNRDLTFATPKGRYIIKDHPGYTLGWSFLFHAQSVLLKRGCYVQKNPDCKPG